MTGLLELKEKIKGFYGTYDVYITPFIKFLMAFCVFFIINGNIGYMKRLSSMPVTLVLALLCAILPVNAMILLSVLLILLHLYALSMEVAATGLVIFALMFLLYFRFAPRDGYYAILTPVCCQFHLGPVMPMAAGLCGKAYSVISVICGTVAWFFLNGVRENAAVLGDSSEETAVTSKFAAAMNQLVGNREMYLVIGVFAIVTLAVFFIHRLSADHAWMLAIVIGALLNFILLFGGYLILGISGRMPGLVIGTAGSVAVGLILEFLFFNVDYSRTERVQFEDDEYYYYVKAVPKIYVAEREKQIKKFAASDRERISRRQLSEEMDISEDLLE